MEIKKVIIVSVIVVVVILGSLSIYLMNNTDELTVIKNVEIIPLDPSSSDVIHFTVHIDGEIFRAPRFVFDALFYDGDGLTGGSHPMVETDDGQYYYELGPYDEGVQIWYMIILTTSDGVQYNESTIDIGNVQYDDGISIHEPVYSPTNLTNVTSIQITANNTINHVVTEPQMTYYAYYIFSPEGYSNSGGDSISSMNLNYSAQTGQYIFTIRYRESITAPNEDPDYGPFPSGSVIFYRIYITGSNYHYATPSYTIEIP